MYVGKPTGSFSKLDSPRFILNTPFSSETSCLSLLAHLSKSIKRQAIPPSHKVVYLCVCVCVRLCVWEGAAPYQLNECTSIFPCSTKGNKWTRLVMKVSCPGCEVS